MVNELRELMREASAHPPQDLGDLPGALRHGRRRVRVRRAGMVGGTALAAGAITLASMSWLDPTPADLAAAGVPDVAGPSMRLTGARPAVEGQDYRELTSYTNADLDADNGAYFDGVTDDGLVLFRDGPRSGQLYPRFALMDPATGAKDWLPKLDIGQTQTRAVELGDDRLVLVSLGEAVVYVFDRDARQWSGLKWPELPKTAETRIADLGPDGRLYVLVPATDATDIRDERLRVGAIGFTDDSLVWTDSSNGAAGLVHVRDLATGEESSFDPELGERCNLLGFSVAGERIAMSQYCGTYEGGVRDDRVQVVTTGGEQIVTVQESGVDGGILGEDGDFLTLTAYDRATGGTYVYDFDEGQLLRLSDGTSSWTVGSGPTPGDQFLWSEHAGAKVSLFGRSGATVHLGELIR
jgi:hypothetical protein